MPALLDTRVLQLTKNDDNTTTFGRLSRKHDTRIAYVESIARVTSLSLTGHILYRTGMADAFLVQWPKLQQAYPSAACVGRVV